MAYTTLSVQHGEVAELTFTTKRGALPPAFWRELPAALRDLAGARAVILRGALADFSVGLDLVQTAPVLAATQEKREDFFALLSEMQGAMEAVANFPAPVIAAVSGWCIGAGLELTLACDLRVCSREARFSLPEVKLGIVSDLGGLGRLPHLIGEGWARRLALTGEAIDAARAERLGLVSEVLGTPEEAVEKARALAGRMVELPATTLHGIKRAMNARLDAEVQSHYRETGAWNAVFLSAERVAGALKKSR